MNAFDCCSQPTEMATVDSAQKLAGSGKAISKSNSSEQDERHKSTPEHRCQYKGPRVFYSYQRGNKNADENNAQFSENESGSGNENESQKDKIHGIDRGTARRVKGHLSSSTLWSADMSNGAGNQKSLEQKYAGRGRAAMSMSMNRQDYDQRSNNDLKRTEYSTTSEQHSRQNHTWKSNEAQGDTKENRDKTLFEEDAELIRKEYKNQRDGRLGKGGTVNNRSMRYSRNRWTASESDSVMVNDDQSPKPKAVHHRNLPPRLQKKLQGLNSTPPKAVKNTTLLLPAVETTEMKPPDLETGPLSLAVNISATVITNGDESTSQHINFWRDRQEFYQSIQYPATQEEEQRMLTAAIEESKRESERNQKLQLLQDKKEIIQISMTEYPDVLAHSIRNDMFQGMQTHNHHQFRATSDNTPSAEPTADKRSAIPEKHLNVFSQLGLMGRSPHVCANPNVDDVTKPKHIFDEKQMELINDKIITEFHDDSNDDALLLTHQTNNDCEDVVVTDCSVHSAQMLQRSSELRIAAAAFMPKSAPVTANNCHSTLTSSSHWLPEQKADIGYFTSQTVNDQNIHAAFVNTFSRTLGLIPFGHQMHFGPTARSENFENFNADNYITPVSGTHSYHIPVRPTDLDMDTRELKTMETSELIANDTEKNEILLAMANLSMAVPPNGDDKASSTCNDDAKYDTALKSLKCYNATIRSIDNKICSQETIPLQPNINYLTVTDHELVLADNLLPLTTDGHFSSDSTTDDLHAQGDNSIQKSSVMVPGTNECSSDASALSVTVLEDSQFVECIPHGPPFPHCMPRYPLPWQMRMPMPMPMAMPMPMPAMPYYPPWPCYRPMPMMMVPMPYWPALHMWPRMPPGINPMMQSVHVLPPMVPDKDTDKQEPEITYSDSIPM